MNKKVKVAFLGSRPLGAYALKKLMSMDGVEIVATVVKEPPASAWWKEDPYYFAPNQLENHSELAHIDFDFGVSINYWKIIEGSIVDKPNLGFINIHHSYNLSLRGRDMTSHAILNARRSRRWYHGTALHYTDDGLDTGPIIASLSCPIYEEDSAWSLFLRTEELASQLLDEWLPRLVLTRAPAAKPEDGHPLHKRNDVNEKFIAQPMNDPLLTYDIVRAYDFNGYFPSAFTIVDGEELSLTIDKSRGAKIFLEIDSSRKVYVAA